MVPGPTMVSGPLAPAVVVGPPDSDREAAPIHVRGETGISAQETGWKWRYATTQAAVNIH